MIPLFKIHHPKGIGEKVESLFESGFLTEGEKSDDFEKMFSEFVGNPNTSLLNSCTSALTLAYRMSDLNSGDEVIATPMTCMATNEPLHLSGAKIVWADIDPLTGNIDANDVEKKITPKTKAIVGVHWAGQPFDIDSISSIANKYNLKVIEDAAHALGAKYNGKPIGSHGDYVCFSFQAIKHLTTADGGAICSSPEDDSEIKKLRWFGLDRRYEGPKWEQDITKSGYKFHMNNLNALIGIEQMKYVDFIVRSHQNNSKYYDENIDNPKITKLNRPQNSESACWIYSMLVDDIISFKKHLATNSISSDPVHVRNDKYTVFKSFKSGPLLGCTEFCNHMINIPVGWWLSEEDLKHIVKTINEY